MCLDQFKRRGCGTSVVRLTGEDTVQGDRSPESRPRCCQQPLPELCQGASPAWCVSFLTSAEDFFILLMVSFVPQKLFRFFQSCSSVLGFGVQSHKRSSPRPTSKRFSPMVSSRSFTLPGPVFKPLTRLELILCMV